MKEYSKILLKCGFEKRKTQSGNDQNLAGHYFTVELSEGYIFVFAYDENAILWVHRNADKLEYDLNTSGFNELDENKDPFLIVAEIQGLTPRQ